MEFPPIDEPTIVVINGLIERCETARRFCETARELDPDHSLKPLLARTANGYERVVTELRDGLFNSAGEATGDGTVKGYVSRVVEAAGQKTGLRDDAELMAALDAHEAKALQAFDDAIAEIADNRLVAILAAQRTVLAGLKKQSESVIRAL